jgi:hypothetical protein
MTINTKALHDELTEGFINYQMMLDNPMPTTNPTQSLKPGVLAYQTDVMFRHKVDTMVSGVMHIVNKHIPFG